MSPTSSKDKPFIGSRQSKIKKKKFAPVEQRSHSFPLLGGGVGVGAEEGNFYSKPFRKLRQLLKFPF